jgi:hypothetical protein
LQGHEGAAVEALVKEPAVKKAIMDEISKVGKVRICLTH